MILSTGIYKERSILHAPVPSSSTLSKLETIILTFSSHPHAFLRRISDFDIIVRLNESYFPLAPIKLSGLLRFLHFKWISGCRDEFARNIVKRANYVLSKTIACAFHTGLGYSPSLNRGGDALILNATPSQCCYIDCYGLVEWPS